MVTYIPIALVCLLGLLDTIVYSFVKIITLVSAITLLDLYWLCPYDRGRQGCTPQRRGACNS